MALEDDVKEFSVQQRTELEGVADQLFQDKTESGGMSTVDQRTNIDEEEISLCMINDIVFSKEFLDMSELSPTRQFKRLASSRNGWKTEAFVKTAQGSNDLKHGSGFMDKMKGLFVKNE